MTVGEFVTVGVLVGVSEGVLVTVGVFVGVDVAVGVFVGVFVGELKGALVTVGVFVGVSEGALVTVGVFVGVDVTVGVLVGVLVGVFVGVEVGVLVDVGVFVGVLVGVDVGVFVGVLVGSSTTWIVSLSRTNSPYENTTYASSVYVPFLLVSRLYLIGSLSSAGSVTVTSVLFNLYLISKTLSLGISIVYYAVLPTYTSFFDAVTVTSGSSWNKVRSEGSAVTLRMEPL